MPLMSSKLNNHELSQRDTYEGGFFSRGQVYTGISALNTDSPDSLSKRRD